MHHASRMRRDDELANAKEKSRQREAGCAGRSDPEIVGGGEVMPKLRDCFATLAMTALKDSR